MAKLELSESGFLPPLGSSGVVRYGGPVGPTLAAANFNRVGGGPGAGRVVDTYSRLRIPRVRRRGVWRPTYAVYPLVRVLRLTVWGELGCERVALAGLELPKTEVAGAAPTGARGAIFGDESDLEGYSLAAALSPERPAGAGWISPARGAGPYFIGFRWLFSKTVPSYRLVPLLNVSLQGVSAPVGWTLELSDARGFWLLADRVMRFEPLSAPITRELL